MTKTELLRLLEPFDGEIEVMVNVGDDKAWPLGELAYTFNDDMCAFVTICADTSDEEGA